MIPNRIHLRGVKRKAFVIRDALFHRFRKVYGHAFNFDNDIDYIRTHPIAHRDAFIYKEDPVDESMFVAELLLSCHVVTDSLCKQLSGTASSWSDEPKYIINFNNAGAPTTINDQSCIHIFVWENNPPYSGQGNLVLPAIAM